MDDYVYLDHAATTPLDPRVRHAMEPFLGPVFGNPSSLHRAGRKAREAVDAGRREVAALIGAQPAEIVFTGSGTESDNLAILGAVAGRQGPTHIITSAFEHPAVLEPCRFLARQGVEVTFLPVGTDGIVRAEALAAALRPTTRLVSIMAANNVVGTIQPIAELGALAHQAGALFHTDAVQAAGKVPFNVNEMNVDIASLSAFVPCSSILRTTPVSSGGFSYPITISGGGQVTDLDFGTL